MLYIIDLAGTIQVLTSEEAKAARYVGVTSRWDWTSKKQVEDLAARLTTATGTLYIGIDKGENVSPRFDVIEAPKVGDEVSKAFNGDYYPCGKITSISKSMKMIITSDGTKFYRRKQTGVWLEGGTFALIQGHHSELNPSF